MQKRMEGDLSAALRHSVAMKPPTSLKNRLRSLCGSQLRCMERSSLPCLTRWSSDVHQHLECVSNLPVQRTPKGETVNLSEKAALRSLFFGAQRPACLPVTIGHGLAIELMRLSGKISSTTWERLLITPHAAVARSIIELSIIRHGLPRRKT
jgi:hypothetical protein